MRTDVPTAEPVRVPPPTLLLVLAFVGFVSLGFPDAAIGIAWPSVRDTYHLRQQALGLVLIASGLGYLTSSFGYGRIVRYAGIGVVLTASTALVAAAMFGFALAPWWALFVACGWVHGLGSGAIDSGLNGYAAHHMPTRHLIWLHACYCAGAVLGPVVMTAAFAGGRTYREGYLIIAGSMVVMSLLFLATQRQWGRADDADADTTPRAGLLAALLHSGVRLQMTLFFLYTGLEVSCSQWTFTVLTESRGIDRVTAGAAVGVFWTGLLGGRVLFGALVDRIGTDRLVRGSLLVALAGGLLFAVPTLPAGLTLPGLGLAGFGMAPVFPCLIARTPERLGPALSAQAIGLQVGSAMVGAAAVPGTLGLVAGFAGLGTVAAGIALLLGVLFGLHELLLRLSR